MSYQIAIDGPAGAGKSTVAKMAAKQLGFIYVDTGAMYRTIALALLRSGTDCSDAAALQQQLEQLQIGIGYSEAGQQMILNGEDVTALIRTEEVSRQASITSAIPAVREKLLGLQRELAARNNVIMDGRDIGTRILPEAGLKIYLTASSSVRAGRRCLELREKGQECSLEEIQKDIEERDYRDMHRETAPLKQAEDAVFLDTSEMSIDQAALAVTQLAQERFR